MQIEHLLKKRLLFGMVLFVSFIFFFTIFGDRGLLKIYKIRKEISRLQTSMQDIESRNKKLTTNIRRMKNERGFQEHSARESLGMVKDNEIIYKFSN